VIALSSTEAEFIALAEIIKRGEYLRNILNEIGFKQEKTRISIDNRGAELVAQAAQTKRSKHYDVRFHYVKEKVTSGEYRLEHVSTQENVADIFTKTLSFQVFERHKNRLIHSNENFPRSYFMKSVALMNILGKNAHPTVALLDFQEDWYRSKAGGTERLQARVGPPSPHPFPLYEVSEASNHREGVEVQECPSIEELFLGSLMNNDGED
jgi:hypothetical protein